MNPTDGNETYKVLDDLPWQVLEVVAILKNRLAQMDIAYARMAAERDHLLIQVNQLEKSLLAKTDRVKELEALAQKLESERHKLAKRSKKGDKQ